MGDIMRIDLLQAKLRMKRIALWFAIVVAIFLAQGAMFAPAAPPAIGGNVGTCHGDTSSGMEPRLGAPKVSHTISHQGRVLVSGQPFSGQGTFYFALVEDGGSGDNLWTNDGSNVNPPSALRPNSGVPVSVGNGVYNVILGSSPMPPIDPNILDEAGVVLRIWFTDGKNGEQLLTPDQPLQSVPYAMHADRLRGANHLGIPVGVVLAYAGGSPPSGWLWCDGSTVSRTTHAELYAAIGTTFGPGNGSTTFNLPDLRGRFPLGRDDMNQVPANRVTAAAADVLGGSSGAEAHTLTIAEMPSHHHEVYPHAGYVVGGTGTRGAGMEDPNVSSQVVPAQTSPRGGNAPHNNMPPYQTLNYIIRSTQ